MVRIKVTNQIFSLRQGHTTRHFEEEAKTWTIFASTKTKEMSAFTLLEQAAENGLELPANTLKNSLIVSRSILYAGTVNLNKVKDRVPHVRGSEEASEYADYKLLTRYFDQGTLTQ